MKKIYIYILLFISFGANAQSPQGISYQAVARDSTGKILSNNPIKIKFSIRDSISNGNIVYQEMHFDTTDAMGLFDLVIGQGVILNGTFDLIDWGKNSKYIQVDLDANTGLYTSVGTQKMMSVPYALYSQTTGDTTLWRKNGNDIYTLKSLGIGKINDGTSTLDIGGRYIQIAKGSSGESGLVKNIPLNTPGYDGSLILGFVPQYSTVELHHQYGGYNGGANANNFYTTFNSTEGGVSAGERMRIAPNGNIGIGTTNPQRTLHVSSVMRLEPIATAPTSPAKGDMYFDSNLNKLRVYDGTAWQNCW
jgi:hypothetical protein